MQIEYHYGYKNLAEKLRKCSFNIASSSPRYFRPFNLNNTTTIISYENTKTPTKGLYMGWLYAQKV
jgi:hypothetical protein